MSINWSRRTFVRVISFAVAIIVVLAGAAIANFSYAKRQENLLQNHYMKTLADLTHYTSAVSTDLDKSMYVKSPQMLSQISSKLCREAMMAKDLLDDLPISYEKLANTNKLLSQVGDYSQSLANSFSRGKNITKEQRGVLKELLSYCNEMNDEVLVLFDEVKTGSLPIKAVSRNNDVYSKMSEAKADISDGFADFESSFTAFPTMIYDGPFSDHILQKNPESLKSKPTVSEQKAREKAANILGIAPQKLTLGTDERSKIPTYEYKTEDTDITISKQGGLLCSMLSSREVGEKTFSVDDAMTKAKDFFAHIGVRNMVVSYYEINGNIVTFNFANSVGGITIYTDLIKVSIALDNGSVVGFDARGYIMNNKARDDLSPRFSAKECKASVSELLTIQSEKMCIIPSGGLEEMLCHEYKCVTKDGQNVLVYVNAMTNQEEQIFILSIGENGTLAA